MLLAEQEIIYFSLNQRAVNDYTAQVINTLNGITNAAERYAVARCLKTIFDKACEECGAAAEAYCEKENIGSDGKEFELYPLTLNPAHKNVWLIRQFNLDYNYAANATDENGNKLLYNQALADVIYKEQLLKNAKTFVRFLKKKIELAHPNMVPEVVRVTMSYRGLDPKTDK